LVATSNGIILYGILFGIHRNYTYPKKEINTLFTNLCIYMYLYV
jgi:hypothetical protein